MLVRVHSECLTGDVFGSLRCDCGEQLEEALARIEQEGSGVLLYLAQEGRGIGLLNKLKAYRLQERGLDTVDANLELGLPVDLRDYGVGAQILADLGLGSIRLMTNNPTKIAGLERCGIRVSDHVPIEHAAGEHNHAYLQAKASRLGHMLGAAHLELVSERWCSSGPDDVPVAAAAALETRLARLLVEPIGVVDLGVLVWPGPRDGVGLAGEAQGAHPDQADHICRRDDRPCDGPLR